MDEPLSNLDAKLRVQMRAEIARLQRDLGVTTVYVTHDQVEAMTMGDRVARAQGRLPAAGRHAAEPLRQPGQRVRRGVHRLAVDEPVRRRWSTSATADGTITIGSQTVGFGPELLTRFPGLSAYAGKRVVVGIRPEDFEDAAIATRRPGRPPHQGPGAARRGARLGADGALLDRRQDGRTPVTPTPPNRSSARASPTPWPASARGRTVKPDEPVEVTVTTENTPLLRRRDPQPHLRPARLCQRC